MKTFRTLTLALIATLMLMVASSTATAQPTRWQATPVATRAAEVIGDAAATNTPAASVEIDPQQLPTDYNLSLTDADGAKETATLQLTLKKVYFDVLITGETGEQVPGIGLLKGDVMTIVFGNEGCYPVQYAVKKDGKLDGVWSLITTGTITKLGTETLTPVGKPAETLAGNYTLVGTNLNSSDRYNGTIRLTDKKDYLTLDWTVGQQKFIGFGLREGDWLAVMSAPDYKTQCALVVLRIASKDFAITGRYLPNGENNTRTVGTLTGKAAQ
jgi:hypothetical protein